MRLVTRLTRCGSGEQRRNEISPVSRQRLSRPVQDVRPGRTTTRHRHATLSVCVQGPSGLWKGALTSLAYHGLVIATDNFLQDLSPTKKFDERISLDDDDVHRRLAARLFSLSVCV
jgi:hypothetical protein